MDDVDRLLSRVKEETRGMLPARVYRRIYETAALCAGGAIVEIGTAQGAATIAIALGAKAGGKPFRIWTADPFRGSSRTELPAVEDNVARVRRGFEAFGVADRIEIVVGTAADIVSSADPRNIGLLMIDADGRIDRDFSLLHGRLAAGCPIVIDDIDDRIYVHRSGSLLVVDQKHRLSHQLTERFVAEGLLVRQGKIGQTGWFARGATDLSGAQIERIALPAYRELVKAVIGPDQIGLKRRFRRFAADRAPGLVRAWRRFRPAPDA
jgi:predicted O-methyltransferase YrrM